jgi:hypothetical protein
MQSFLKIAHTDANLGLVTNKNKNKQINEYFQEFLFDFDTPYRNWLPESV